MAVHSHSNYLGGTNSALLFAHSPCNEESSRRVVCLWMHCARATFLHLCMGMNVFIASSVPSTDDLCGILSKSEVHNENVFLQRHKVDFA